ncbi:MAG: nitrogenase component 1 [Elusimicrobiota bacterium]
MKSKPAKKKIKIGRDLKKFGQPLDYPYLLGVYMAVNAVPGTAILIDGPDCAVGKAEHLFGKHDGRSTLLDCSGLNRVECTFTDARNTAHSREAAVRKGLLALAARDDVRAVLLSSLPMTFVTGTDYRRILRGAVERTSKPLYFVSPRSLQGGYLDGFAAAQQSLAEGISRPRRRPARDKAALVGYLMDRGEEDHRANLQELRRLLGALGVDVVSAWFDGSPYAELDAIGRAGTIISLPYGRRAARAAAKRTGAEVLELGLPVGIDGTRRWLEKAGAFFGGAKKARRFIESELRAVVPRLEWVVPHSFLHKRFWISADPHMLAALTALVEEFGGRVVGGAVVGSGVPSAKLLVRPTSGALAESLGRACAAGVDLVIGGSDVIKHVPRGVPAIELGFPSYFTHALHASPTMGFAGSLALMDRMANAMSAAASPRGE